MDKERTYRSALIDIAGMETPTANATVRRMAGRARQALIEPHPREWYEDAMNDDTTGNGAVWAVFGAIFTVGVAVGAMISIVSAIV